MKLSNTDKRNLKDAASHRNLGICAWSQGKSSNFQREFKSALKLVDSGLLEKIWVEYRCERNGLSYRIQSVSEGLFAITDAGRAIVEAL